MTTEKVEKIRKAVRIWNNATNPSAYRTEWEHSVRRKLSKKVLEWIRDNHSGIVGEREWDSSLYIK